MKILVTGANGFVGRQTCWRLCEAGFGVRAAVRSLRRAHCLPTSVDVVEVGDIRELPSWDKVLPGIDSVVHLVGRTHVMNESGPDVLDHYRAVNVDGTQRLMEACRRSGIRQFVYMSSIKAVGEGQAESYTEDSPCWPEDPYGVSKREAEVCLLGQSDFSATVLRPPLIYGRGAAGNLLRMMKFVERGIPLPLAGIRNRRSMVHVANLADAVCCAVDQLSEKNRLFHVSDGSGISTPELVHHLAAGLGVSVRLFYVPVSILRATAALGGCGEQIRRLTESLSVCGNRIGAELSWRPTIDMAVGLRDMAATYRNAKNATKTDGQLSAA